MPGKKRPRARRTSPRRSTKRVRLPGRPRQASGLAADLAAVHERLDMMLPELIARVAAVEHLLVEKGVCAHDDLLRARRFIDEQESW